MKKPFQKNLQIRSGIFQGHVWPLPHAPLLEYKELEQPNTRSPPNGILEIPRKRERRAQFHKAELVSPFCEIFLRGLMVRARVHGIAQAIANEGDGQDQDGQDDGW